MNLQTKSNMKTKYSNFAVNQGIKVCLFFWEHSFILSQRNSKQVVYTYYEKTYDKHMI